MFYNREDVWEAPHEIRWQGRSDEPYYVLMKLPGENRLGFLLMIPVTPRNRDNMMPGSLPGRISWLWRDDRLQIVEDYLILGRSRSKR